MEYLEYLVYTPLDKVVHEGLSPNPLHVVLIAQSLFCRYKTSFNDQEPRLRVSNTDVDPQFATGAWQLILKVASFRCKGRNNVLMFMKLLTYKEHVCFSVSAIV